jgi:crotonobetainyl-CoA:carnitine CoA-transferase CaiB-like acyl-CoA transferase
MKSLKPGTAGTPLAGITAIDLGQIYQGPYAGLLLAKAGADVIKVEPPAGEPARLRAPPGKNTSLPMAMLNSNKRGITLNLKTERGRELLKELAKRADVVLENFAPGVMDRLGVGFSVLHKINPKLIYASGTGYGLSGPDRDRLAMDVTVQAASGMMSITGFPDGPPLKAGPTVVDFASATHLYAGILTALYERERTGIGRLVEVSMQECVYPMLATNLGGYYNSGGKEVPRRTGNLHGGLALVPHNVYPAKDGHVALQCVIEEHWTKLIHAMGREDLKDDPRFASNARRVENQVATDALVTEWTSQHGKSEIFEIAKRHRIPCAPVRDLVEVMNDRHMHERGALEWIDHPELGRVVVPTTPLRLHGAPKVPTTPSPALGESNVEIYGDWLGLPMAEITELKRSGVI